MKLKKCQYFPPYHSLSFLKFIYSEKATKFCEISTLLLSVGTVDKSKVDISENFVAFLEYTNFTKGKSNYHFPRDPKTDEHSFDLNPKFLYVLRNRNFMLLTKEKCHFFASSNKINEEQSEKDARLCETAFFFSLFS